VTAVDFKATPRHSEEAIFDCRRQLPRTMDGLELRERAHH
jgi:hypothetical protein